MLGAVGVRAQSLPDLVISGLTVGAPVTNADGSWAVPVHYVVTNNGSVAAAPGWLDKAYLSDDAVLDSTDYAVGNVGNRTGTGDGLAAGASYTVDTTIAVSSSAVPATYYFIVKADGHSSGSANVDAGSLAESNEANNTASAVVKLARPDLSVSGLTVGTPVTNVDGSWAVPVHYVVTNNGSVAAAPGWLDKAYLSDDAILDGTDYAVGNVANRTGTGDGLAAGASYTVDTTIAVSSSAVPATYYFIVKADGHSSGSANVDAGSLAESNESNNTASAVVKLARPDLSVSGLTVGTPVTNVDGSWAVPVHYVVTNNGSVAAAPGWLDKAYLSDDAVLDSTDYAVGNVANRTGTGDGLAAGASYTVDTTIAVSSSAVPATYYFIVKADGHSSGSANVDAGSLAESNESNNTASAVVKLARPDLSVSGLAIGTIVANSNGSWTVPVHYVVTNNGNTAAAAGWLDRGYFSTDNVLDNADSTTAILYNHTGTGLAAGASYTVDASFSVPTGVTPGTYYLIIKADGHNVSAGSNTDTGSLAESNESNNVAVASVVLNFPDLSISGLTLGTVVVNANGTWTYPVHFVVTNLGSVAAQPSWSDVAYLSSDAVLDNADSSPAVLDTRSTALAAGANYIVDASYTVPAGTSSGTHYLIVKTDGHNAVSGNGPNTDNGSVTESSESNNAMSASFVLPRPDLKISGLSVSSVAPYANDTSRWIINATYTVTNVGTATATGGWTDMGFLSTNGVLDNNSISDRYFLYGGGPLAAGASYTQAVSFITPVGVAPGNYSFFLKTDSHNPGYNGGSASITDNGNLAEGDETNNAMSVAVSLTRPDLKISGLTILNANPYANDTSRWVINASYTVTNVGTAAANSSWTDMGFLSSNGVLDANSISDRYFLYGTSNLAPGSSYSQTVSFLTPAGVAPGNYSFFLKTDAHNPGYNGGTAAITDNGNITETDETNNAMSAAVTLSRPDLKISGLTVTSAKPYANDTSRWVINATYTVTNVGTAIAASGWTDMGFLSSNGVLDNNSISDRYFLYGSGSLAPGGSYTQSVSFITPAGVTPGNYAFFLKTDARNPGYNGAGVTITDSGNIAETDETNNAMSVAVSLGRPDLTVTALHLDKVTLSDGIYKIALTYTVKNIGAVDADKGWTDMGYLSTNGVLDNNSLSNYFLYGAPGLAAGASYTYSSVFTAPSSTPPGNYTFFLKADGHNPSYNGAGVTNTDGGTWAETNEANNTMASPVYLPIGTTTTMASSVNPVKVGASTTLSAAVTPSSATGTVSFYKSFAYGLDLIGTAPVSGGTASLPATFSVKTTSQPLIATYSGDSVYYTSTSSPLGQAINTGDGAATLTASAATIVSGRPLTLTATLPSAATGTFTFMDGATTLGQVALAAGKATLSTSSLTTAGTHVLTAAYSGDSNFVSGTSNTVNEVVTAIVKSSTTTAFQAAPAFVVTGGSVTVAVTITGSIPGGNVAILDGATTVATLPVVSGHASGAVPLATAGSRTLSAQYPGDDYNDASWSTSVTIQVNESSSASPGLMTWIYGYDARGNRWIDIDPNGHETDRNYDKLDRPFQILSPFNTGTSGARSVLGINYDGQDRVSSVHDPLNMTTSYTLDGLGNQSQLSSPDTGATKATVDADGNMLTRTDSRGNKTTYAYDALGRLNSATYASGTSTIYTYDGGASPTPNSIGHLTLMTDESGSTAFTYDFRGNVIRKVQTISGKTLTTLYTWGTVGASTGVLTSITYPSGTRTNYLYDTAGQVSAVTLNPTNANGIGTNTSTTVGLVSGITHNGAGKITGWTWNDNVPYRRTFDRFGRLTNYPLGNPAGAGMSAGLSRTIVYDGAAQILGYVHANSAGAQASFDQQFGYDTQGRLISDTLSTVSYGYSYDANGNRTSSKVDSTTYLNSIAATSNRLGTAQGALGTQSFTYDNVGDTLTDGVATYTYSARGRMASAKVGSGTISYLYNGLDQRVIKSGPTAYVPSGAAYYAYDEAGRVIGEYNANVSPIYETVYLGDAPIAVLKQTGTAANSTLVTTSYNVYADQTLTPRIVTRNSDEAIVWRWDTSEAFGASPPNTNPSGLGVFVFNQRFPGQIFDAETGNFYNWNRDYDPTHGRYEQSDPIGLVGGSTTTYGYVDGTPVSGADPKGLSTLGSVGEFLGRMGGRTLGTELGAGVGAVAGSEVPGLGTVVGGGAGGIAGGYAGGRLGSTLGREAGEALDSWMFAKSPPVTSSITEPDTFERQSEYLRYKYVCNNPPPPNTGNHCQDKRNKINWLKQCRDMRQEWDDRYWPRKHEGEIRTLTKSIKDLERVLKNSWDCLECTESTKLDKK